MCRGAAEVSGLACAVAGLADGAAGFDARGAKQTGDLLEMELDCIGAENFGLREVEAGVANLGHATFEAGDIGFKV